MRGSVRQEAQRERVVSTCGATLLGAAYQQRDMTTRVTLLAQFIIFCSASHLAAARSLASPVQDASPAKTWASTRPSRAHDHPLRPSTNCDTLSVVGEGKPTSNTS